MTLKVCGKLTIDFQQSPPATASPPPAAPGASPPTPPVAPHGAALATPPAPGNLSAQDLQDKEKVLETVRQFLEDRKADENQKLYEAVEDHYNGLQEHLQDLEDCIDRENRRTDRRRCRNN